MILGYDTGASAVKVVALRGDEVIATSCYTGRKMEAELIVSDFIGEQGLKAEEIEAIAVTGVGAEQCRFGRFSQSLRLVPEIEATGLGGSWLSGLSEAVVVSIGTGTSIALARNGTYSHVGGSGVGSGTLRGVAWRMFGLESPTGLFALAEEGDRLNVDLTIRDLFSGTDSLPPDLTASNLAKALETATKSDWALAIINTVMEVAGSHAALACKGFGVQNVVITGGISQTDLANKIYDNFSKLYQLNYVIPAYSDFATAIGAVRWSMEQMKQAPNRNL